MYIEDVTSESENTYQKTELVEATIMYLSMQFPVCRPSQFQVPP